MESITFKFWYELEFTESSIGKLFGLINSGVRIDKVVVYSSSELSRSCKDILDRLNLSLNPKKYRGVEILKLEDRDDGLQRASNRHYDDIVKNWGWNEEVETAASRLYGYRPETQVRHLNLVQ